MTLTNELLASFGDGSAVRFQDPVGDALVSETGISYVFTLVLTNALPIDGRVVIEWPADWPQTYEPSDRYTVSCLTAECGYGQAGLESDTDATGFYLSRLTFTGG